MGIEKYVAYYNKDMDPSPIEEDIDGMWITKSEPHLVVRVWKTDSERPKLAEEPDEIQAYSKFMAKKLYEFKEIED